MPVQRHNVVIPREDGGVQVHPLKEWLRQNPDVLPGIDPSSSNSHQLRSALRRAGWSMQETPTEVRLIKPGANSGSEMVNEVLGSTDSNDADSEAGAPYFSLEYQLRDFLASNLNTISINGRRLRLYVDPSLAQIKASASDTKSVAIRLSHFCWSISSRCPLQSRTMISFAPSFTCVSMPKEPSAKSQ